ncbi:hypothetical protein PLICBS_009801 [Purpureocillium lilacinum]|uniref:uncharacterized protein n=1 Tax=Purpureocillium lilacinum TaxID=33203 RepID=UPI00208A6886|nr:hypothetical protein PLICBS_009801 [Purpureocillium lilacinum]
MDPSKLTELTLLSKYIVETYAAAPLAQLHLGVDQDGNLKPSGLTLVSKFYPVGTSGSSLDGSSVTHAVANYSYPRNDSAAAYTTDRPSTGKSARSSVGSNGSSPGLTDDRTISEVSFDDDYQCHTYTSRLWDGFWTQEALQRSMEQPGVPSKNHYPATIPPPLNPSRRQLPAGNQVPDVKTPATRRPRQHKSMTDLLNRPLPPLPEPDPEPRSVFEDDSSDEDQDSERHRSFYLFHGRSSSDNRRPSKSTGSTTTGTGQRNRALPGVPPPVPPKRQQPHQQHQQQPNYHFKKPSSEWKRQDSNVFGRVFGHAQRH